MRKTVNPLVATVVILVALIAAWLVLSKLTDKERVKYVDGVMVDEQNRPVGPPRAPARGPQYRRGGPRGSSQQVQPTAPSDD